MNAVNDAYVTWFKILANYEFSGGTAAAAPPPSGLATLPSVGAVP